MKQTQQELVQLGRAHLYPNYRQPDLVLSHGRGSEVFDVEGKRYLDLMAGIAVTALGHAHPVWTQAVAEQAGRLAHISNYFFTETNVRLAAALCERSGFGRAFFCNSGTEAIEACLKLARRHFYNQQQPERHRVIAFERSFHGRTMGALAATGQPGYRDGFGPLGSVTHVPYGNLEAVAKELKDDVAAVLVEPVQGEGGVVPAPSGFLEGLRELTDKASALLLVDEIQTGVARTGRFLAIEHSGVKPDAVALAKGLGGGFPIGAMLCTSALENALPPGSHGTTFGGNPLASAAALAVLDVVESEGLCERAELRGRQLDELLQGIARQFPRLVRQTRGLGLLRAMELSDSVDARLLLSQLREHGLLLTLAGGTALRFCPALNISEEQLEEAAGILRSVLGECE